MKEERSQQVPVLDSFRGVAALGILLYHCWLLSGEPSLGGGPVRDVLSAGFLAVTLFFVLSGFVLFLPVARRGGAFGPVRPYARRRVARVAPAYYAVLVVCLLAWPLLTTADMSGRVTLESVLAHVVFAQQEARLLPGYEGALGFAVDPVVWTLSLEALFYLALPFVAGWFWRWPWHAVALAVAVGVVGRVLLGDVSGAPDQSVALSSFPLHLADFAVGMGAALLFVRQRALSAWLYAAAGAACAVVALVALAAAGGPDAGDVRDSVRSDWLLMALLPFAFAGALLGIAFAPAALRRPFEATPARWLGRVSYGVFLSHYPLLLLARTTLDFSHDGSREAFVALTAFALPASLLVGWMSWVAVEQPARRWARGRSVVASR
ncbi:MAG TPA: acyltransferase [Solirubrobacteraceae bacterium]|nr:acyltransferase [Solirubrobacteraceae bacterium]